MTTLRIYDRRNSVLALDLRDLVDLLAPRSLEASWTVSPVTLNYPQLGRSIDEVMIAAAGQEGRDDLERFAAAGSPVGGTALSEAAHAVSQVIWGQFVATLPEQDEAWVIVRAVDSTFYEVTSADASVLSAIRSTYKNVRVVSGPVTSAPIERV